MLTKHVLTHKQRIWLTKLSTHQQAIIILGFHQCLVIKNVLKMGEYTDAQREVLKSISKRIREKTSKNKSN